jgi:hypothetical protein
LASKKKPNQGKNGEAPLDIHPDWLNVVRAAQAVLKDNKGFSVMTIIVSVVGNKPIFYEPVIRHGLHPARAANKKMTPQIAGALMALMDKYVDEPVIIPDDKLT